MKRSRLNGLANKTQNSINIKNFKKQWNILLKSNKKIKRNNMNSLKRTANVFRITANPIF